MSVDSPALFDDDTAFDVRHEFAELLGQSRDPAQATADLLARWSDFLQTSDRTSVFWLALAAVQRRYGCLQVQVRDRAIAVIDDGSDLQHWKGLPEQKQRATVLRQLRRQLLGPQPRPSFPGRRRRHEPPRRGVTSPDGKRIAEVVQLGGHRGHPMSTCVLIGDGTSATSVLQVDCPLADVTAVWRDNADLEISYPRHATVDRKVADVADSIGPICISFVRVG